MVLGLCPFARRSGAAAALLLAEGLIASFLFDSIGLFGWAGKSTAGHLAVVALWAVHFLIAFAAILGTFVYLQKQTLLSRLQREIAGEAFPVAALIGNSALFFLFLGFSGLLSQSRADGRIVIPWLLSGIALVGCAGVAALPLRLWFLAIRELGALPLYALIGAAASSSLVRLSESFWAPMSGLTFSAVELVLRHMLRVVIVDRAHMRIGSARCTAIITPECSGMEGVGLLLIFLSIWLRIFRKEIRFPHALIVVPVGVILLLVMNVLRIAGLILIGDAGYRNIAAQGFHSQAGWILFNAVAFGIAVGARGTSFLAKSAEAKPEIATPFTSDQTAAYLVPFLGLLAAGMLSQAVSGGFEWLYGLRAVAVGFCLWRFRRDLPTLGVAVKLRTAAIGVGVYVLWIGAARVLPWETHVAAFPPALASWPVAQRYGWIIIRAVTAVVLVPVAEELAFRGFLLRRLTSKQWERLVPRDASWFAVIVSSSAFAALHDSRWLEAILAGIAYAWVYRKSDDIREAITAHGITNALVATHVLTFGDWSLW